MAAHNIYHGNLITKSIILTDEGEVRLCIPYLMNHHNHYKRKLIGAETECYLSPLLFSKLGENNF